MQQPSLPSTANRKISSSFHLPCVPRKLKVKEHENETSLVQWQKAPALQTWEYEFAPHDLHNGQV